MQLWQRRQIQRKRRYLPAVQSTKFSGNLTRREMDVLELIAEGYTRAEVGKKLFIGEETVKSHTKIIRAKLNARNTAHCIAIAYRQGMLGTNLQKESISPSLEVRPNLSQMQSEKELKPTRVAALRKAMRDSLG